MAQAVAVAQPVGQQTAQPVGQASFYSAGQSALQQWFAMVDTDRSGQISATELQQALSQGGLTYSLKMVASIIRSQAPPGSIQLDFQGFCRMQQMLSEIQQGFRMFANPQTNTLNLEQVYAALQQRGHTLDKQPGGAFYTLCQSFDFDHRGVLTLDTYVAMVITLENAKKVFGRFGSPQVHMTFDQFVWASSQM
uniref:EF-hand domain-containing protein n=1 Tax=Haptolina ericina TaxID=156174 RepID=A0A7S3ERS8_9EUKA